MSKKQDELSSEELKQTSGAGEYTVEAQKVVPRGTMKRGVYGTDPGNVGNTDPDDALSDRRLQDVSGAGPEYSVEAQKVVPRGTMKRGVHGTDPGNVGNTDPVFGEVTDSALSDVTGGAEISAEKTSNRGTYGTGQVENDPSGGRVEPNPILDAKRGGVVKP